MAGKVFLIGLGEDDIHARAFALKLSLLGILTVHNFDPAHMSDQRVRGWRRRRAAGVLRARQAARAVPYRRYFRERDGKVVTVTRHTSNPLRAHADIALLVSAHDERPYIEPLLYHAGLQHLLDRVFVLLCEGRGNRLRAAAGQSRTDPADAGTMTDRRTTMPSARTSTRIAVTLLLAPRARRARRLRAHRRRCAIPPCAGSSRDNSCW